MSPTLPQPAPLQVQTLEAGKGLARLAQARAASRPGLCASAQSFLTFVPLSCPWIV